MKNQFCAQPLRRVFIIAASFLFIAVTARIYSQPNSITAKAIGTGRTTGHVATLSVTNTTPSPVIFNPQSFYIPSSGQYQPYIASIPGTTVPPGTMDIPVDGYCADVHTPPVPVGNPMPPIEEWIPVDQPGITFPEGGVNLLPSPTIPAFQPEDISRIVKTPGYTPGKQDPKAEIIITWPGTDIPVGGTFKPGNNPEIFAPVVVKALEEVVSAADTVLNRGEHLTPFSPDPALEREAVIQQTLWIYTAALSGKEYKKEDFANKVIEQFQSTSGTAVEAIPEEQQEKLNDGIDDFWKVFTAVGTEAKVLGRK